MQLKLTLRVEDHNGYEEVEILYWADSKEKAKKIAKKMIDALNTGIMGGQKSCSNFMDNHELVILSNYSSNETVKDGISLE